eukprot:COSAG02_NODE_50710_length_318_cov_3.643836_2_plen_39_part_01
MKRGPAPRPLGVACVGVEDPHRYQAKKDGTHPMTGGDVK